MPAAAHSQCPPPTPPVEELATQLDLQKANFSAQIRRWQLKAEELQQFLAKKDENECEKQAVQDERERLLRALGRFMQQKRW